eukprot:scaffold27853_cov47-Phaeocystis_antarctica.AAC.4
MACIDCRIWVTHLLGREKGRQLPEPARDIPPNITPHMFAPSDHHLPRPSAPMGEIRIHHTATAAVRTLGTRRP